MESIKDIQKAIEKFGAITWSNSDYPLKIDDSEEVIKAGWIKFELEQTELGWRTLEFLAWAISDMLKAGEEIHFFPTSPPPYLNEPGKCLSFVMEFYPENEDTDINFKKIADFITYCREEYWEQCKGRLK